MNLSPALSLPNNEWCWQQSQFREDRLSLAQPEWTMDADQLLYQKSNVVHCESSCDEYLTQ